MASFDALAEAYVRLRARDDGSLNRDVQSIVGRVATDAASLFAGKKLLDVGIAGLDELKQAQTVTTQTAVQLRATGEAAGISAQHIQDLGQQMLDLAGFDDEAARSAANVLLQFNQIKGTAAFDRVLKDSADLSVTIGQDLPSSARILGLALQAPEQAARLLRSANISLTQAQKEQLTAAEATNDVGKEQDVILGIVESRVKGAAAAYGQTLTGSLQRAQEEMKNAKAELVAGFTPAIEFGANATTAFAHVVEELPTGLQAAVGGVVFLGGGLASLIRPVGDVLRLLDGVRTARAAKAAATLADVGADEASAAAATTDAAAQEVDAAATEGAAVAHEAAGVALTASLGPIGLVAAGVGILAVALAAGGQAEHNAAVDAADFTQALKQQGGQAAQDVDKIINHAVAQDKGAQAALAAGVSYRALFDAVRSGTDDFGQYGRVIEAAGDNTKLTAGALRGAGAESTEFGRQLIAAAESGDLTEGKLHDLVKTVEGLHNKYRDQVAAQDAETAGLQQTGIAADGASTSIDGVASSTDGATTASKAYTDALAKQNQQHVTQLASTKNLFDAEQAMTTAEHGVATAARGVTDAERSVDDANRRLEDSYRSVADAQKKVQDAQEALNKAMAGATAEELGKANLDLSDAQLQAADATQAVADAQHKLDRDTRLGRTRALPKDQEDLTKAQNALERSLYGVTDAQDALNKTQQKGSDQDPAVIQARKDLDSANRNLTDSEKGVRDAVQGVADAQQRVVDAKDRVNDAYVTEAGAAAGLKDAQANLYGSSESVNTSLRNQIAALQGIDAQLEPGSPARQHLDDYINHLFVLAGIFETPATGGQPLIVQLPPGVFQNRAAGGALDPNVPTWVGEDAPELAFHNFIYPTGRKRGGAPGGVMKGGDSYYYDYTINYPAPEPASGTIRREFARQSVLNGG